jgi:hypothetical protein
MPQPCPPTNATHSSPAILTVNTGFFANLDAGDGRGSTLAAAMHRAAGMTRLSFHRLAPVAVCAALAFNAACGSVTPVTGPTSTDASATSSPSPSPAPNPAPTPSPTPSCTTTITDLPATVSNAEGRYTFAVVTPSNCTWTASTDVPWADIAPGSGQGATAMLLVVAANTNPDTRTATVTVNGQTARVVQNPPGCSYSVAPTTLDVNADSTGTSVTVTTTPGCGWTASASESWISPRVTSGSGSATIVFDITASRGDARHAFLTVAGQRVEVTQQGR